DALAKAKLYTEGLGVTLGPVLRIDEHGQSPRPVPMARAEMALASDVPISGGEVGYRASVTVVFGLE
ncbi:MAG: SIMPL domain-containing protein, partial [Pseudomonadota bacterium]